MKLLENLKLDRWYRIVLCLGVALITSTLFFKIEFIDQKNIFGLGIGMIIIGVAYIMSERQISEIAYGGIISTEINKHNCVSMLLIIIGFGLIGLFGFKIIQSLI